jgi:GNAT superfamily N-acetyltransferase
MATDVLLVVPFSGEMLAAVSGFDYGDEPYQQELCQWMAQDSIPALLKGTKIWLYRSQAGEFVGYSSLGLTRWKYPDAASTKVSLVIVPAVAIRKQFWGKPEGPAEDRYSSQIMRHLLAEAEAWPGKPPAIGLFVHPDNNAAAKLYERFGFQPFFHSYSDPVSRVVYRSLIKPIVR